MRAPGHVLMTADAVGGVWMYALELSRALAGAGVRVTLAVPGPQPASDQRADAAQIAGLQLTGCEGRLEWMSDPWSSVAATGDWLLRLADDVRPDLVHLNDYSHGALSWQCPSLVVAHSCVISWWNAVHECDPPPEWTRYRQSVRAGLLGADTTVAVSRAMADAVVRHYAVPMPAVVWNGRTASEYHPETKQEIILTSGRAWDDAKNIGCLDAAAPRIQWPVWLAGDTQQPHGGERDVRHLNTLGRLSQREMREWFSRATIYAMPALYEPFGLSILEAALSGCALVLGGIESLREIWGDAAVFADGRDPDAIAHAANSLIADATRRSRLAAKARTRALELTPERMLSGYLDAYSEARTNHSAATKGASRCAS